MQKDVKYFSAVDMLNERIRGALEKVSPEIQPAVMEVRLRVNRPVTLVTADKTLFLDAKGQTAARQGRDNLIVAKQDLQDSFILLCGWAVHSHQQEMANGYISVRDGHRAGVAATAVVENGHVNAVRDITSINLRIAREIPGAADDLIDRCFANGLCGVLLAGAPASGKTTILRDIARQLSSDKGLFKKVCVVDESGEIGAASGGIPQNDLGVCSDLLSGYPKAKGLEIAVRYLSPQMIVCDEVCTAAEVDAVATAANSGTAVATSIHAASFEELGRKPQTKRLLQTGAFQWVVLLAGADNPSKIQEIKRVDELCIQY